MSSKVIRTTAHSCLPEFACIYVLFVMDFFNRTPDIIVQTQVRTINKQWKFKF